MRAIEQLKTEGKAKPRATKPKKTEELVQPNPQVFPVCSACQTPYVLRLAFSFSLQAKPATGGKTWAWFRDCKHKKAPAEIGRI